MEAPYQIAPDTYALSANIPVPSLGVLPVNAYLIKARQPVLIDTQMPLEREAFFKALESVIDPRDLRWVFLTHDDRDHNGNIMQVLDAAPDARVVTNFVGLGRMTEEWLLPMERVYLLNPGQSLDVGDRALGLLRPPLFDSPASVGVYDSTTSTLFSCDSFGAFIPSPVNQATEIPEDELLEGLTLFNRVNHPWVTQLDTRKYEASLDGIARLGAKVIASSHGPAAAGMAETYVRRMAALPAMDPWVGPDQAALEAMLASMAAGTSG